MTAKRTLRKAAAVLPLLAASFGVGRAQQPEELRVVVGKSVILDYPSDVARISTSNPEVIDAVAVTTREILLNSKAQGAATLVVWSKDGQRTIYNVAVEQNLDPLRRLLRDTFPGESIQVQVGRTSLSLVGKVSSTAVSERAAALAAPFGAQIVNNLTVTAPVERQILLRVRFAELNRRAASEFAVNLSSLGALNTIGGITTGQVASNGPPTVGVPTAGTPTPGVSLPITDALNIFAFRRDLNLAGFLRALQTQGLLQVLAEPNLVTTNGREANFLVGGEFPVPVLQGGGNAGAVTVQFREFGIRINFLPTITANNTIRMFVRPEVSTLDYANGVALSGFTIPALSSRRIESTVELAEGQSFVIAGLVDDRVTETLARIPGLANLPILGQLFKSRIENKQKSELLIMVTPEVVNPLDPTDPKPTLAYPKEFLRPLNPVPAPPNSPQPSAPPTAPTFKRPRSATPVAPAAPTTVGGGKKG